MTGAVWAIALSSISLSAIAQLLMKFGMLGVRSSGATGNSLLIAAVINPYVFSGFAAYGIGAVLWLKVLSQADLSLAYPMVSLGFILVAMLSWVVLGEQLPLVRILGIALIVVGVALIGWST